MLQINDLVGHYIYTDDGYSGYVTGIWNGMHAQPSLLFFTTDSGEKRIIPDHCLNSVMGTLSNGHIWCMDWVKLFSHPTADEPFII
jgi:hypothetical protein